MKSVVLNSADSTSADIQSKCVRVSIGMPVFNGEEFLEDAIKALLCQSFKDFELIISDNASDDLTPEICRKFAEEDSRIRYFRNDKNLGAAENFNRVVNLANGEYFMWVSHDDLWAPQFIEKSVSALDNNPNTCLCYSNTILIDERGTRKKEISANPQLESPKASVRFSAIWDFPPQVIVFGLIRTSILRMTPLIGKFASSDRTLAGELALRGPFYAIKEPLFFYRHHKNQSTGARSSKPSWFYLGRRTLNAWYDPTRYGQISFPHWRILKEYIAAISRVSPGMWERLRCYLVLIRWMVRYRTRLLVDLVAWSFPTK